MKRSYAMTMLPLLILLSSMVSIGVSQDTPLPPKEKFHLYILAGQSNMAGRGKVSEADQTPHPRVLMLTRDLRWMPAVDPIHFDKPGIAGVGLGKTFAILAAEAEPDVTIGLIPCAVGGSPIEAWEPGGFNPQTKTHPWDDSLQRIGKARERGVLKGILWHQGESDGKANLAPRYEEKLHDLVNRFRNVLQSPNLPFIAGQMGQFEERPWNEHKKMVDLAHQSLPDRLPHCAFVSAEGLSHKGDEVHFDATSYRELGRRFYEALRKLAPSPARDNP